MKRTPYRISSRVLRVLSVVIAVMFVLFFLVGYNRYYEEDSQFKAPLLTDVLLVFVAMVLIGTLGVTVWSIVVGLRSRASSSAQSEQIPLRKIHGCIAGLLLVVAAMAWLLGSSEPLLVNGAPFVASFWLRTADMFVALCIALVFAALVAVGYSSWQSVRKRH